MVTKHQKIRFKKMVELASPKEGNNILDIGCGNRELKQFLNGCEYTGIDKSFNPDIFLDVEKQGIPKEIFKRKKFDIIFLGEIMEHIENHMTLLNQCKNLLKEDGKIIMSTPLAWRIQWKTDQNHTHSFTTLNLKVLAGLCGLKITKMIGSFVHIPLLEIDLNVDWTFYTNNLILRMERINKHGLCYVRRFALGDIQAIEDKKIEHHKLQFRG